MFLGESNIDFSIPVVFYGNSRERAPVHNTQNAQYVPSNVTGKLIFT